MADSESSTTATVAAESSKPTLLLGLCMGGFTDGNTSDSLPFGFINESNMCLEHLNSHIVMILIGLSRYADHIANAKWEVKELGLEHNGYVDLLLGEFKHYKMRIAHGGIQKEVQDLLLEYGLENVAETLIECLSRVLINGLKHFVSIDVKPKMQIVETFIKAYYLPETEYVHWSRAHQEYSKSQIVGLINLVATMKGWKRKTRLEVLEKIE
ncbi:hypothetical protein ACS0TY_006668 [Phlomoides rotata]